jgi:hypothetical protein
VPSDRSRDCEQDEELLIAAHRPADLGGLGNECAPTSDRTDGNIMCSERAAVIEDHPRYAAIRTSPAPTLVVSDCSRLRARPRSSAFFGLAAVRQDLGLIAPDEPAGTAMQGASWRLPYEWNML